MELINMHRFRQERSQRIKGAVAVIPYDATCTEVGRERRPRLLDGRIRHPPPDSASCHPPHSTTPLDPTSTNSIYIMTTPVRLPLLLTPPTWPDPQQPISKTPPFNNHMVWLHPFWHPFSTNPTQWPHPFCHHFYRSPFCDPTSNGYVSPNFSTWTHLQTITESNTYPVHYVVYLKILDFGDANSVVDVTWKLINMEDDTPPLDTEITLSVINTCDTDVYTQKYISLYNSVHDLCIDFDTKHHKGSGVVTMIPYDAVCMDVCCYRRNKTAGWLKKENHTYTFDHAKVCPSLAEPLIVSVKQI